MVNKVTFVGFRVAFVGLGSRPPLGPSLIQQDKVLKQNILEWQQHLILTLFF